MTMVCFKPSSVAPWPETVPLNHHAAHIAGLDSHQALAALVRKVMHCH